MTNAKAPRKLPRGHHGLSEEEVRADQIGRLLDAITDLIAEVGYRRTTVARVIRRAGVSRTTFYSLFENRADCFDAAHRRAIRRMDVALREEDPIAAIADMVAAQPALPSLLFVAPPLAGPGPARRYLKATTRWSRRLADAREIYAPVPVIGAAAASLLELDRIALGGVAGLLTRSGEDDHGSADPGDLVFAALLPMAGPSAASAARDRYRDRVASSS